MALYLLMSPLLLMLGCCHCHFELKTVYSSPLAIENSTSDQRSRILSCKPPYNAAMIIRTARYIQDRDGVQMTSSDVTKVYRHCQGRLHWCDVTGAGVTGEFKLSYYCMKGPFFNPCSNTTTSNNSSTPAAKLTTPLLFNYSRHTTDCDVTCQCDVTSSTSSNSSKLFVTVLNFYEEDGEGDAKRTFQEGCNRTMEQPGRPHVMMASSDNRWEVERRAVPAQWQLKGVEEDDLWTLTLRHVQGVPFGHVWIELEGQEMMVTCETSIRPRPILPVTSTMTPVSMETYQWQSVWFYIVVGLSVLIVVSLVVLIFIGLRCRRGRSGRLMQNRTKRHQADDNGPPNCSLQLEGEYCTITDFPSSSANVITHVTRSQPRDKDQPIVEETSFSETANQNGDKKRVLKMQSSTEERSDASWGEYETLHHGPAGLLGPAWKRSETDIYDHTGNFGKDGDDEQYRTLRHCVSVESRVIDNVYDTTTNVKRS